MSSEFDPLLDRRVLICGDRNWTDAMPIQAVLYGLLEEQILNFGRLFVIEGCARGADSFACRFYDGREHAPGIFGAIHQSLIHEHFPADWTAHGRSAGPIRNRQMLAQNPSAVYAFHDDIENSKGTKDMVTIAEKAGITVYVVSHR